MVDNYRPTQPLNNRIVRRVEEKCRCEHPDAVCARDGTCYVIFAERTSALQDIDFATTDAKCDELGMIIAEPRTWVQYGALMHILDRQDLFDFSGGQTWLNIATDGTDSTYLTDDAPITYSNWDSGQPNKSGCILWEFGDMYSEPCSATYADFLVCQEFHYTDKRD